MAHTILRVRDSTLERVAEVDDYTSLEAVLRFRRLSAWALTLPADTDAAQALLEPGAGLVIVRDGETILSGPRVKFERKWSAAGDLLQVSGVDDLVHVAGRLAHPDPAVGIVAGATGQSHDVRTGALETVLRAYVNVNAGPGALAARQVPGIALEAVDAGQGSTVTGRARWQGLLEFLDGLAVVGGDLGFRVRDEGAGILRFEVYTPTDRSTSAIFAPEFGNLAGFTYSAGRPRVTHVVVGGGGVGISRTYTEETAAAAATWGRIEGFRDRRDTTDPVELEETATEFLAENGPVAGLSISPLDTDAVTYGVDYALGDRVTVRVAGVPISDVVREVTIVLDESGETVKPQVAAPSTGAALSMLEEIRRLRSRVSTIERV